MGEYLNEFMTVMRYHYLDFKGRARRRQYWMYVLMTALMSLAFMWPLIALLVMPELSLEHVKAATVLSGIGYLIQFITLLPSIAVSIRRMHDIGKSGWFILLPLIPIVGIFAYLYFAAQDSQPGTNKWGPNPKEVEAGIVSPTGALQNYNDPALEDW